LQLQEAGSKEEELTANRCDCALYSWKMQGVIASEGSENLVTRHICVQYKKR